MNYVIIEFLSWIFEPEKNDTIAWTRGHWDKESPGVGVIRTWLKSK